MEYVISALIPAVAVAVIVIVAKRIASHTFQCGHCGGEFSVKWTKVLVTVHSDDAYKLECPYCKTRDWCEKQP